METEELKQKYATRFRELIENLGMSDYKFASETGLDRMRLSKIVRGLTIPGIDVIDKIKKRFPEINLDIFFSSGAFLASDQQVIRSYIKGENIRVLPVMAHESSKGKVLLVNQKAAAGYTKGFSDQHFLEQLPVLQVPGVDSGYAFEISGDSMEPVILDHEIVICSYMQDWTTIRPQCPYIVVTREDGIVCKYVINELDDKGRVILQSRNPKYTPYSVDAYDVLQVWKIDKVLSLRLPDEIN